MKERNPYRPMRYAQGFAEATRRCPEWRMVTVVLEATLPGRAWPKQAFASDWRPPPPGTAPDGPPAWHELDHTGAGRWHDGTPLAPAGIVCDMSWAPVAWSTPGGHDVPVIRE